MRRRSTSRAWSIVRSRTSATQVSVSVYCSSFHSLALWTTPVSSTASMRRLIVLGPQLQGQRLALDAGTREVT